MGKMVCGNCCVEVGAKGRIWCMTCYGDEADSGVYTPRKTKSEFQMESVSRVADWLSGCDKNDMDLDNWCET